VIDIHCHILPEIDDGPSNIMESIEMAKIASRDGIKKIVATPHIKDTLHSVKTIKKSIEVLNNRLTEIGIPIEIVQGADVNAMLDLSLLEGYTINNTDYILIEFPHSHLPKNAKEILFNMMIKGYRPIITHPERNLSVIKNPNLLFELLGPGSLVQITADSLTGAFGVDIQECAFYLLERETVSFIATDAHSSYQRQPILSEGLKVAERIIGKEKAAKLVTLNPEEVLAGRTLND
jgi:protein-tyrosine phosphatase